MRFKKYHLSPYLLCSFVLLLVSSPSDGIGTLPVLSAEAAFAVAAIATLALVKEALIFTELARR